VKIGKQSYPLEGGGGGGGAGGGGGGGGEKNFTFYIRGILYNSSVS